ncbi:MAG: SDR family NAD(P)-dependent oxidoreductase [Oscillospiraceae bacterium]|jgi:NADP-dependent 3-hydroxy acid dehydrogenase YdfG|nr:SDR family NAD(P)-dependent oxidoreductase [Oscillospiraceae bacterium]
MAITIKGSTAFVTGAASGVGFGIAKALAKHGANIIIADIRQSAIDEALVWFSDNKYPAYGIRLDVTDREAYGKAADEAWGVFGGVEILVNNAGVEAPMGKVWLNTFKDVDFIVGVNIKGILNGIITFVPKFLASGKPSHIVSTASQSGMYVVPGAALYNMTKAAVVALTETLKGDLAGTNVDASVFAPGPVQGNLSVSSKEVRPAELANEETPTQIFAPTPPPEIPTGDSHTAGFVAPPPVFDFSSFLLTGEQAGEYVVRGIESGALYIFTHTEFRDSMKHKHAAIERAYPDEPEKAGFKQAFSFLTHNAVYDEK